MVNYFATLCFSVIYKTLRLTFFIFAGSNEANASIVLINAQCAKLKQAVLI